MKPPPIHTLVVVACGPVFRFVFRGDPQELSGAEGITRALQRILYEGGSTLDLYEHLKVEVRAFAVLAPIQALVLLGFVCTGEHDAFEHGHDEPRAHG